MSEENQGVLVPVDVFNAITEYLSQRPYKEVSRIIDEIRQGAKVIEVPEQKEEESVDE
jgi:hypothetical protein